MWPDARLRAYLRERGISEDALPTDRPGLLRESDAFSPQFCLTVYAEETRIRWVQTTTWAENIFSRLKEIINNSVEAAEDKIARILEVGWMTRSSRSVDRYSSQVLSGHSRDATRECADVKKTHAWSWCSHKANQAKEMAEEARQRASENVARGKGKVQGAADEL